MKPKNAMQPEMDLADKFVRISEILRYRERQHALEQGLTVLQNAALRHCFEEEQIGNYLNPLNLAQRLMVKPATLSTCLKALEKKKLLHRHRKKEDERSYFLQLSDGGRAKAKMGLLHLSHFVGLFQPIPAGQKEELDNLLGGIIERMKTS